MSDKLKTILKRSAIWIASILVLVILILAPNIYLLFTSSGWNGKQAVCYGDISAARESNLRDISSHLDYWGNQLVSLSGKLSYNQSQGTFYLRDGVFTAPLDVSNCENLGGFKTGNMLANIYGVVVDNNNVPLIEVAELRQTVPGFVQVLFNAGYLIPIILIGFAFIAAPILIIAWIWRKILSARGKPVPNLTPEERKEKIPRNLIILSVFIVPWWLGNPVAGLIANTLALIIGRKGLETKKKKLAIVSLVLLGTIFIVMLFVSIARGSFWDTGDSVNFYSITAPTKTEATGIENLELKPYVSKDFYFSIHMPKGWTESEEPDPDLHISLPVFKGPQDGTAQGKPYFPKISVGIIQAIPSFGTDNLETIEEGFKRLFLKSRNPTLLSNDHHVLSGGRLDTIYLEGTDTTKKDNADLHTLSLFTVRNGSLYVVVANIPTEKWNRYETIVRNSLDTLEVFQHNLATCLKLNGAVVYGFYGDAATVWQKQVFAASSEGLPYVECTDLKSGQELDFCVKKGFVEFPIWKLADGSELVGGQDAQTLAEKTGCNQSTKTPAPATTNPGTTTPAPAATMDTYKTGFRTSFIQSCSQSSGGQTAVCTCVADYLTKNYTDDELTQMNKQFQQTPGQPPQALTDAVNSCK